MPQNNSGVISALPSVDFECGVCNPDTLNPSAMHRGDGGADSVFHKILTNKLDAADVTTDDAKAVFTTSLYSGSDAFSLTVQASTTAGNHDRTVIYPTYVEARQYKVKDSSGSFSTTLTDAGLTLVGATTLSGGNLSWDGGGDSGRSALLKWNASNSLTVNSSGTTIVGPLIAASFTVTGATTINNNFAVDGNTTLGDASASTTDTLAVYARSVFHNTSAVPEFKNGLELSGTGKNLTFGANTITGSGNITTSAGTITGKTLTITGSGGTATVANAPTGDTGVVRRTDVNVGTSQSGTYEQAKDI